MMPSFVVFSLLAAVALGGYSFLIKILLRYRICDAGLVSWCLIISTGMISLLIAVTGAYSFPIEVLRTTVLLAILILAAHWFLSLALQEGDASTVVPLLSLKIPFVAITSIFILGERHTANIYIAAVIAALGVAMFGIGRQQHAQGGYGKHPVLAIILACLSALSYAFLDQGVKHTLIHTHPIELALWLNTTAGGFGIVMLFRPHYRQYRIGKTDVFLCLLGGCLMCVGMLSFVVALNLSEGVTIPNIVLSTRGFFALLIGFTVGQALKIPMEKQSRHIYMLRLIGSGLLLTGLILALK